MPVWPGRRSARLAPASRRAGRGARSGRAGRARVARRGDAAADWVVDRRALAAPIDALLAGLDGVPPRPAAGRRHAARRGPGALVRRKAPPAIFDRVVADLAAAGRVVARDTIALAGHRLALTGEESRGASNGSRRAFRAAGLNPPDPSPASLAAEYRRPAAVVERVLQLLVKQKRLVRLDTLVFHHEALERLKADIAGAQGDRARRSGERRRQGVQGHLRPIAEVRDSAARVSWTGNV